MAPYEPTRWDPLDVEVAKVVNSQPLGILLVRVDPPIKKGEVLTPKNGNGLMARYTFSSRGGYETNTKPVMSKLVDRGNGRRKVLVKIGGGWMDLELFLLGRQAAFA